MKTRSPKLFEASFSMLRVWEQGDWDRAIKMYFRVDETTTDAMEQGKKIHKQLEEEVKKTGCYPVIFGGRKIDGEFKTELRYEKKLDDWLQLNGVVDLLAEGMIQDYKSGISSPYSHEKQLSVYNIFEPEIKVAVIRHFNQYNKVAESVYYHLSEKTLKNGFNWVVTQASEMFGYLEENNIYKLVEQKYGKI